MTFHNRVLEIMFLAGLFIAFSGDFCRGISLCKEVYRVNAGAKISAWNKALALLGVIDVVTGTSLG